MSSNKQKAQAEEQVENNVEEQQVEEHVAADMKEETPAAAEEAVTEAATAESSEPEAPVDESQARIAALELELEKAKAGIADYKDAALRAKADADNIRRRAAIDVDKSKKYALEKFANELLPVIDNMERGLQHADKENEALVPLIEGIELTARSLESALEKFGVKAIDPQGLPFNPEQHQAMSMVENPDVAPNTVIAVMQKGYELNGRLIRPAMVMVSKGAPKVDTTA